MKVWWGKRKEKRKRKGPLDLEGRTSITKSNTPPREKNRMEKKG